MAYDISVPHAFKKQGIYHFERRVPRDLESHYAARKNAYSLQTRSAAVAAARAARAAQQLVEHWYYLRVKDRDLPGKQELVAELAVETLHEGVLHRKPTAPKDVLTLARS